MAITNTVAPPVLPEAPLPPTLAPYVVDRADIREDAVYTVLRGYGTRRADQVDQADLVIFRGGIARDVPGSTLLKWYKAQPKLVITILRDDAPDRAFARAAGFEAQEPVKTAAILRSTDIDALVKEMGQEGAQALYEQLGQRIKPRRKNG